jgi:hypothetical protein
MILGRLPRETIGRSRKDEPRSLKRKFHCCLSAAVKFSYLCGSLKKGASFFTPK